MVICGVSIKSMLTRAYPDNGDMGEEIELITREPISYDRYLMTDIYCGSIQ